MYVTNFSLGQEQYYIQSIRPGRIELTVIQRWALGFPTLHQAIEVASAIKREYNHRALMREIFKFRAGIDLDWDVANPEALYLKLQKPYLMQILSVKDLSKTTLLADPRAYYVAQFCHIFADV